VEPVRYELELIASAEGDQKRPAVTRQDVVLAKSSLFRFEEGKDSEARLQKVLSYDYEKSEYYGQVSGTVRGLSTLVRLPNGQIQSMLWGMPDKSRQKETLMVGYSLRHYSAVDVSVVGVRVTEEQSYRGTLTSVFPDGARRERRVEGVVQRRYLNNIRPEYSRVYRIKPSVTVNANQQPGAVDDDGEGEGESENRRPEAATALPATEPTTTRGKSAEWDLGSGWEKKSSHRRTDLMVSDQIKNNAEERQSAVISGSGGVPDAGLAGFAAATATAKVAPLVTCLILAVLLN